MRLQCRKLWRTGAIVAAIVIVLIASWIIVKHLMTPNRPTNAHEFVTWHSTEIKHDLYQKLDPQHQHIHSITLISSSADVYSSTNGSEFTSIYSLAVKAYVNHNPQHQLKLTITFPHTAETGIHFSNPYKSNKMTFATKDLDITTMDKSHYAVMKSWWNWNNQAFWDNFADNMSKGADGYAHKDTHYDVTHETSRNGYAYRTVEKIFMYHQNNIFNVVQQYWTAKYPNQTITNIGLLSYYNTFMTDNKRSYFDVSYHYTHGYTPVDTDLKLHLTRNNLNDPTAPIKVIIRGKEEITVSADATLPSDTEINAFHQQSAHWLKDDDAQADNW